MFLTRVWMLLQIIRAKFQFAERFEQVLGHGIFAADGASWKIMRQTAAPLFTRNTMSDFMMRAFVDHTEQIMDRLRARAGDVAAILGMDHEHIGLGELGSGGEGVATGSDGAAGGEERHPLGEEAGVVVRAGTVGVRARTDEDTERGGGSGGEGGRGKREEEDEGEEAFHGEVF